MKHVKRLFPYMARNRGRIIAGIAFIIGANGLAMLTPLFIKGAIDSMRVPEPKYSLSWFAGAIVLSYLASSICRFFIRQTLIVQSRDVEYDLRQDLWWHLQTLDQGYYSNIATGDVMARLTSDMDAVRMFPGPAVMYLMDGVFRLIFMVGLMAYLNPLLTVGVLLPLPMLGFLVYQISKRVHHRFTKVQEAMSEMNARAQQDFSGIRVIKSYTSEEHEAARFEEVAGDYRREQLGLAKIQAMFRPILMLLPSLSGVVILGFGGWLANTDAPWVAHYGLKVNSGDLAAFMICLFRIVWPIMAMGWVTSIAQRADASMKRLNAILDHEPTIRDGKSCDHSIQTISGDITFENVTVTFQDQVTPALKHVDLTIPWGKTVAIVGRTGAGKSTLINLLPRLIDPSDGRVTFGGKPLQNVPLSTLRGAIGMASQTAFLFSDSIRNNILIGNPNATEEELARAIHVSGLDQDMENFPDGLDSRVGERGLTLSGGQKQRCSLARAVISDPDVLVLDDTMSAVDTGTEERILSNLKTSMVGRTTILISHRISTVQGADLIVVLDDGCIIETGTHAQLIERRGVYEGMHRRQLLEREINAMGNNGR